MLIKFNNFLLEKLAHPDFNDFKKCKYIISYKKYIYFIPDNIEEQDNELFKELLFKLDFSDWNDNIYDLLSDIKEDRPDIILLEKHNNNEVYFSVSLGSSVDISISKEFIDTLKVLAKNGVEYLNVQETTISDVVEEYHNETFNIDLIIDNFEKDLKFKKLPEYVYHGTSSDRLESILKIGLRQEHKSNFDKVYFKNKYLFFSSNILDAYFYADNAAKNDNSFPIILEISRDAFDINLVDKDYDFFIDYINKGNFYFYDLYRKSRRGFQDGPEKEKVLSHLHDKYIGATYRKFSYKGNIFPKYIMAMFIKDSYDSGKFDTEIDGNDLKDYVEYFDWLEEMGYDKEYYIDYDQYLEYEKSD